MPRILVIDDDEPVRAFVEEILKRAGYDVRSAEDGAKGLKLCKRETFDLVITDLFMPEKEGCETIIELRRLSPLTRIIAVSGGCRINGVDCLPIEKPSAPRLRSKNLSARANYWRPFGRRLARRPAAHASEKREGRGHA